MFTEIIKKIRKRKIHGMSRNNTFTMRCPQMKRKLSKKILK